MEVTYGTPPYGGMGVPRGSLTGYTDGGMGVTYLVDLLNVFNTARFYQVLDCQVSGVDIDLSADVWGFDCKREMRSDSMHGWAIALPYIEQF